MHVQSDGLNSVVVYGDIEYKNKQYTHKYDQDS